MTESMSYLHEFETQRLEQQDTIGIEIELPPTIDMVKQKRTAVTTRSIKNRQRSHKHHQQQQHEIGRKKKKRIFSIIQMIFIYKPFRQIKSLIFIKKKKICAYMFFFYFAYFVFYILIIL